MNKFWESFEKQARIGRTIGNLTGYRRARINLKAGVHEGKRQLKGKAPRMGKRPDGRMGVAPAYKKRFETMTKGERGALGRLAGTTAAGGAGGAALYGGSKALGQGSKEKRQ